MRKDRNNFGYRMSVLRRMRKAVQKKKEEDKQLTDLYQPQRPLVTKQIKKISKDIEVKSIQQAERAIPGAVDYAVNHIKAKLGNVL